ncbi:MAG: DUF975 family protein [Clostridia bacterium]|nr:DUF975 family protein [Clostridia bacterium]
MDSKENEFVSESQQVSVSNSTVTENVIWSIKGFKKSALESLKGRWKIPLIASLITIGIIICLMVVVYPWEILFSSDFSAFNISSFIGKMLVLYAVILLIFPVLTFSYLVLIQKMRKTKEKIVFSDYVEGFSFWNKGILAVLWQCLWYFLWALLYCSEFAVVVFLYTLLIQTKLSFLGIILLYVALAVLYIFIYSKYYSYCMNLYILANNPKIKIKKALSLSIKITNGYRGKLFLLDLSFFGWYLLCCLTLGIGLFFFLPYYSMTFSTACEFLRKKAIKNCVVNAEDCELLDSAISQTEEQK